MPRKTRNKPRNSKTNNMSDNLIMIDEHSHDLNGTSLGSINSPSCPVSNEISKKRAAEVSDDATDSNSEDLGPPRKKRNNQDFKKAVKRSINILEDDSQLRKSKAQKYDNSESQINFGKRIWQESNLSSLDDSHAQKFSTNSPHFVIATYNILLDQRNMHHVIKSPSISNSVDNSNYETRHMHLMQELDYINADILCLQQVSYSYWKDTLECSLRERGFSGDIVIGDKISDVGVATLYQLSRFLKVDFESNKLSKLCVEQIPLNNGLDEATLNSVKQYLDEPDSYIVTVLKDKQMKDERLLIVGNTHLSSPSIEKQDLRCVQAVGMFWKIHRMITQIKSDLINNNNTRNQHFVSPCWILCGDFNSNPDSPVYQICRDGYPDEHSIVELQSLRKVTLGTTQESSSLVDLLWHSFQHPLTDSCSSYLKVVSYEPSKDYIWISEEGLQPSKVLMPCSSEYHNNTSSTTNNNRLPSDHMSLACDVSFMT